MSHEANILADPCSLNKAGHSHLIFILLKTLDSHFTFTLYESLIDFTLNVVAGCALPELFMLVYLSGAW